MAVSSISRWLLAALLAGTVSSTAVAQMAATPVAAHPTFTVSVVGKGRPVLLIPSLNTPGPV